MSCKGEIVIGVEERLRLLPSYLFNEIFLDCIGPYPQSNRSGSYYDQKPRLWHTLNRYGSIERPSNDVDAVRVKPRGTGVFLPERPMSSSPEKRLKNKPCPIISSHSRKIFLPSWYLKYVVQGSSPTKCIL